jgi:hypothetical protein
VHESIDGIKEAETTAAKFRTPRTLKLDKLRRYVDGTQYEGREDFMSPQRDVPLLERAPAIVHPVTESAIRQHVDLALGEGRFPKLTTGLGEDDSDIDELFGLSEDDSETLDGFLSHLCEHVRFQDISQDALESAEATGTACVIYSAQDGYLCGELVDPRHATPKFATNGRDVVSLEIKYPYVEIKLAEENKLRATCMLYRRVIDAVSDTVYLPAKAPEDGRDPKWSKDAERSADHGLGFCPVVWYAFKRRIKKANEVDGHAIHETQLDEIDALNFSLSQRHRAALYSGDPQMVETGVSHDEEVAPSGSQPVATLKQLRDKDGSYITGFGYSQRPREARRKGAGVVWRYEHPDAKVALLTLPGDALKAISDHCADMLAKVESVLGYTATSPEQVKGALSGKALGFLFARTTAFVDRVRRDFWDGFMLPSLAMLMRMCLTLGKNAPESIYVPGAKKALPILEKFQREVEGSGDRWFCPRIKPVWGRYFENGPEDEKLTVETAAMAFEKKLMTREIAVEKLRGIFAFDSATEVAEQLDEEAEEELAQQQESQEADREIKSREVDIKAEAVKAKPKAFPK